MSSFVMCAGKPQEAPLHSIPRRKHADQILAELEADRKTMKAHRPVPTGENSSTGTLSGSGACFAAYCM